MLASDVRAALAARSIGAWNDAWQNFTKKEIVNSKMTWRPHENSPGCRFYYKEYETLEVGFWTFYGGDVKVWG
jgi:hypothetical protein